MPGRPHRTASTGGAGRLHRRADTCPLRLALTGSESIWELWAGRRCPSSCRPSSSAGGADPSHQSGPRQRSTLCHGNPYGGSGGDAEGERERERAARSMPCLCFINNSKPSAIYHAAHMSDQAVGVSAHVPFRSSIARQLYYEGRLIVKGTICQLFIDFHLLI